MKDFRRYDADFSTACQMGVIQCGVGPMIVCEREYLMPNSHRRSRWVDCPQ